MYQHFSPVPQHHPPNKSILAQILFIRYNDQKLPQKNMNKYLHTSGSRTSLALRKVTHAATALALVASSVLPQIATAASSWKPTLLVNTEAFQEIDAGNGTSDIELRFGASTKTMKFLYATQKFQFSHSISVLGTMSGSSLNVDRNATVGGTLTVTGAVLGVGSITAKTFLSGSTLRVSGPAAVHGELTASGAFRGDGDFTINDDRTAGADAVLTFGNQTTNQTLKYLHSSQRFQFSKDVSVVGGISGSTLRIDGNAQVQSLSASGTIRTEGAISGATLNIGGALTLRGLTYNAPTTQGAGSLTNDGAGNLTWTATSVNNGSGLIMSMHPEYPGAVYFSSGSSYIGQLFGSGGTAALDHSYVWTSTRGTLQDYWVSVRFRIPNNFSSWDAVKPIELRYKTGVASAANNHITVRMKDTAGTNVTLTNGGALSNTSWTTANVTGPEAAGTWTPKGYATIYVKLAADSTASANAAAGFINLNFETTTP